MTVPVTKPRKHGIPCTYPPASPALISAWLTYCTARANGQRAAPASLCFDGSLGPISGVHLVEWQGYIGVAFTVRSYLEGFADQRVVVDPPTWCAFLGTMLPKPRARFYQPDPGKIYLGVFDKIPLSRLIANAAPGEQVKLHDDKWIMLRRLLAVAPARPGDVQKPTRKGRRDAIECAVRAYEELDPTELPMTAKGYGRALAWAWREVDRNDGLRVLEDDEADAFVETVERVRRDRLGNKVGCDADL